MIQESAPSSQGANSFYLIKPWTHQLEAIERAIPRNDFALFFDVGAGKTSTCINILRHKYQENKRLLRTLVFGPPIILQNWKQEILKYSMIEEKDILVLTGTQKNRCKQMEKMKGDKIVITNYESLLMKDLYKLLSEYLSGDFPTCMVCDESHRLKSIQAKRTKAAIELSDKAYYKYLLTGTPILNSMMDIWSQFRILDGGESFGKNYFTFRNRYFYDRNSGMSRDKYFPDWKPREGASEEINNRIAVKSMYVSKAECLDLPPLIKKTIPIELTREQAKAYKEMLAAFITFINDKAAVAELAITKALRLQQIVSGFVSVEDTDGEKSVVRFKNKRKEVLKDLLEELTVKNKVLVWAVFKENYKDIREVCEKLGVGYVEVHGEISEKDKFQAVDDFNNSKDVRVLIGHPGSGGIGINLVSASYSVFYSRSFSLEYDIQAEARNYRGGSERHAKITRIDLVAPGTIEEQVLNALASKKKIGYEVLKGFVDEV
jgi:SNF2 family DNA or RNA helicase